MLDFIDYKYDVLVATTIIENGIDIPRANTIIINRADQLRAVAALSAARPRRAIESTGVCVPDDPA